VTIGTRACTASEDFRLRRGIEAGAMAFVQSLPEG
jgi:hypothetical protein